jgi:DNA topoisomerase-1
VRSERGSASIVVAAILWVVLVLAAGAGDLARVVVSASRAQTAADAAALAAARELAVPSQVEPATAAAEYAARNGATLLECTCLPGTFEAVVLVGVPVGTLLLSPDDHVATARARAVVEVTPP